MKMKPARAQLIVFALLGLLLAVIPQANAQTNIWTNPITGTNPNTNNPYISGQTVATNITVSGIGRGTGINGSNANDRYNANGWDTGSIDLNAYFTFTLTPDSGYEIDFNTFFYTLQRSATGPQSIVLRSSLDSFSANLWSTNYTAVTSTHSFTVDLSGASFQNITNGIEFRIYGWGATGSGGTMSVNDFAFTGTVNSSGPPPSGTDYFWTGNGTTLGGSGTWGTTNLTWSATNTPVTATNWDSSKKAIFTNTAGTVTVGTVTAEKGVLFATTGYTLDSGVLTMGGTNMADNTITTDADVTATIDSQLSGSNGLTKAGTGTLILGGANDYSGGTLVSAGRLVGTTDSLQGNITNNAAVTFDQDTGGTYSDNMSGSGSVVKDGAGTVTFSGTNSYTGGTTVAEGGLVGTTDSLQGNIANEGTVTFDQTTTGTYAGNISGGGSVVKDGAGTVTFSGTNSYTGGTEVADGRLVGTTASLQGDIENNSAVEFKQGNNGTYEGEMSGSGQLIKSGGGNVTLAASNSYTGGTEIEAGTLTAADDNALGVGDVAVAGTARLLATGGVTIANDIVLGQGNAVLYSQDFNALGEDGLPTGWAVYTNATASSMGGAASFSTNQVEWANSSGAFKNFASATGLTSSSDITAQNASEDRALGIRQTGSFGDPGAAFTYSFSTTATTVDSISLDLMMLSVQTRSTTWSIEYGLGENPTSFTTLGTWSDPGTWGTTPIVFTTNDFGTALNNQDDIVFRVVALTGTTGSGIRDSMGLDNFVIGSGTSVTAPGATIGTTNGTAIFTGLVTLDGTGQLLAGSGSEAVFTGVLAGDGGIKTIGAGTVTLAGSSANTYEGDTTVATGTLRLAKDDDTTAVAGNISVANGATLLIAANNQVADTSEITLSGGTIKLDGVVTETFGNLNVTSASFLDFNDAVGANMSFDEYTPISLLTVNNFIGWSTLTFNTDLTDFINDTEYFSFANGFTSAVWDSESGVFTITAIPEPSTYAAAAGLLGMMLWPARRRILRDTKRILGLRTPMRDRLGRRDA
ncbi:MAG: autotransporter-associated beta strand repeat-containing protein [Chthoniobacterales bacterium]|nr:autotransporter-associated beta strand repeat-containing protein [Chthoniobacterales bacterium]